MSDSIMNARGGIVVGTAGHIDHGKTALIGALTGIDTDRLAEEKRRGISIDLGFAHLTLPNGKQISFVDVPGHERFIRNMLAGAAGIEAVLLIVAADEGIKPQTREHFDICRLLGVERGIVVLTKSDLASAEQMRGTHAAVQSLTASSFLANAPVIPVSAVTRAGLRDLMQALTQLSDRETSRDIDGPARLPIDRSFALKGFGTVVTGTLGSGCLHVGDTVELRPTLREARVRGLQVHGKPVTTSFAGERTAVNLSGVNHSEIRRGFVLVTPKTLELTGVIHASLTPLVQDKVFDPHEDFVLHVGTSDVSAHIKLLQDHFGKEPTLVQINLAEPVVAAPGDRFILRRPSPSETVAGGCVIDPFPPGRLSRAKASARLMRLHSANVAERLELLVDEKKNGRTVPELVRLTGRPAGEIAVAAQHSAQLLNVTGSQQVVSRAWLARQRAQVLQFLTAFHTQYPASAGAPLAQVRFGLEQSLAHFVLANFPPVHVTGELISLATHRPQVSQQETAALHNLEQVFRKAGYQPASPIEVLRSAALDAKTGRSLLEKLIKNARLVRVTEELIFHADVIAHIRTSLSVHKGRRFSVPEFKQWTQISRKYAIPLLEYLDHQRVTKRDGDYRVVL